MKAFKRKYQTPIISMIEIDQEISLILYSPPAGPNEGGDYSNLKKPDYLSSGDHLKA